jgi:hypothetical protein
MPNPNVVLELTAIGIDYAQSDADVSTDLIAKKKTVTGPF